MMTCLYLYGGGESRGRRVQGEVVDDVVNVRQISEHRRPVDELSTSKQRLLSGIVVEADQVPRRVLAAHAQQVARRHPQPILSHVVLTRTQQGTEIYKS